MQDGREYNQSPREKLLERIESDFTYHPPSEETKPVFVELREMHKALALKLIDVVPNGRELSTALTKLEEAVMHANAGIARHGLAPRD